MKIKKKMFMEESIMFKKVLTSVMALTVLGGAVILGSGKTDDI